MQGRVSKQARSNELRTSQVLAFSTRRVAAASASLPLVCPSAIGKAFGLAAATRFRSLRQRNLKDLGHSQQVWPRHPAIERLA
jgi:hypothetical protein